jgi:hypothetical protein
MIHMIPRLKRSVPATGVIAAPLLALQLSLNVLDSVIAFSAALHGLIIPTDNPTGLTSFVRCSIAGLGRNPFRRVLISAVTVLGCLRVSGSLLGCLSLLGLSIAFAPLASLFRRFANALHCLSSSAFSTVTVEPASRFSDAKVFRSSWKETVRGFRVNTCLAARTLFQWGIHSASLSLYLKWVSAGGEIDRRFGCTALADARIIPQRGA